MWKKKEFLLIVALLVITGIYVNLIRYARVSATETVTLNQLPNQLASWTSVYNFPMDNQTMSVLQASDYIWRNYRNEKGENCTLFLSYFKDQQYGAQIHSPKHCLPGGGWKILDKSEITIPVSGENIKINRLLISNGKISDVMLYWFCTRSGPITNEFGLKIDLAKNSLFRQPTDAAFIRINLPFRQDVGYNEHQFTTEIINAFYPAIKSALPFFKA
jgi:EpsI family protein